MSADLTESFNSGLTLIGRIVKTPNANTLYQEAQLVDRSTRKYNAQLQRLEDDVRVAEEMHSPVSRISSSTGIRMLANGLSYEGNWNALQRHFSTYSNTARRSQREEVLLTLESLEGIMGVRNEEQRREPLLGSSTSLIPIAEIRGIHTMGRRKVETQTRNWLDSIISNITQASKTNPELGRRATFALLGLLEEDRFNLIDLEEDERISQSDRITIDFGIEAVSLYVQEKFERFADTLTGRQATPDTDLSPATDPTLAELLINYLLIIPTLHPTIVNTIINATALSDTVKSQYRRDYEKEYEIAYILGINSNPYDKQIMRTATALRTNLVALDARESLVQAVDPQEAPISDAAINELFRSFEGSSQTFILHDTALERIVLSVKEGIAQVMLLTPDGDALLLERDAPGRIWGNLNSSREPQRLENVLFALSMQRIAPTLRAQGLLVEPQVPVTPPTKEIPLVRRVAAPPQISTSVEISRKVDQPQTRTVTDLAQTPPQVTERILPVFVQRDRFADTPAGNTLTSEIEAFFRGLTQDELDELVTSGSTSLRLPSGQIIQFDGIENTGTGEHATGVRIKNPQVIA